MARLPREHRRAAEVRHRLTHLAAYRARDQRRRERFLNAVGGHTQGEWDALKRAFNFTCVGCNRTEPTVTLTRDHKVPLVAGGSDRIDNIQPLCGSCNSRKHTTTAFVGMSVSTHHFVLCPT
jgi:5-methylcytosine-specific restriction endonuclease McrA